MQWQLSANKQTSNIYLFMFKLAVKYEAYGLHIGWHQVLWLAS